jgi:hypothetical protein
MKRFWFLAILMTVLTACVIEGVPRTPEVTVAPATVDVAPGGQVDFSATVNDSTPTNFEWELVGTSFSFVSLESNNSRIRVTAPTAEGEYTLRATTTDFESTPGEAELRVNRLLAAPFLNAISAPNGPTEALRSGTLQAGDSTDFAIVVTSDIADDANALFFEAAETAGTGLALTTYSPDLSVYASSSAAGLFTAGALSTSDASLLTPQALPTVLYECFGPCVIRDSQAATFYVRLTNTSGANLTYSLFAYVKNYDDSGENANDQQASAPDLTDSDRGAIESLGDVDYYDVQGTGTLTFTSGGEVDTVAILRNAQGTELARLTNGQTSAVQVGQRLEVRSASGNRAAPGGSSAYGLDIN